MSGLRDFGRFVCAVLLRWQAYVTGSLLTAIVFVYEHVSRQMISANTVLWGVAGFFITGAFMAWREQYQNANKQSGNKEIIEKLGEFLSEGEHFKSICHDPKLEIYPGDQIALWGSKLDAYLASNLGASYAVRVKSASGLGSPFATNLAPGLTQRHWLPIHIRCVRLNQFISELSSQSKSPISSSSDQT